MPTSCPGENDNDLGNKSGGLAERSAYCMVGQGIAPHFASLRRRRDRRSDCRSIWHSSRLWLPARVDPDGSTGAYYHVLATRLADRAKRNHGSLTVIPTAGSIENVDRLARRGSRCTEKFALIQDGIPVSACGT